MLNGFEKFSKKNQLFGSGDRLLLAVSGGIDSVVLTHLCAAAGFDFGLAHCNFGLRGKESNKDELFVRELAAKLKVEFHSIRFDTKEIAKTNKESIQIAARALRYNWFEQIRVENNYDRIVLAHHQNDASETFFINLLRGTGISGLLGIPVRRNYIVRPLLFSSRSAIEKYARQMKLKHREDSSNSSDKYLRNVLRHKILPALGKLNPGLEETMIRNMEHLSQVNQVYRKALEKELAELKIKRTGIELEIDFQKLTRLEPALLYLFELIRHFGFNETSCMDILSTEDKAGSGQEFFSTTHRLIKDRDRLIVVRREFADFDPVALQNEYVLDEGMKKIEVPLVLHVSEKKALRFSIPRNTNTACLDKEKLKFPLIIRRWKKGDAFVPFGMHTNKKLSDFFIDAKFSRIEKERTWLLVSGRDIVWIIGHRINERYKVEEKTNVICIFIYEPGV